MHLIFCVDERDGLSFCGRRLSRDREIISNMLELTSGKRLWIHPYSANLFAEGCVLADEDYLRKAKSGDYCWIEKGPFPEVWHSVESVTLYYWNREYPSTERFPRSLLQNMHKEMTTVFPGNSHEKITIERFVL